VRMEKEAMKFLEALSQHKGAEIVEHESAEPIKRRA
jgi:hypothetical protein